MIKVFCHSTIFITLITLVSCASSRKNIAESEIVLKGGVYQNKSWDDKLNFKRISWYNEATMEYDVLIHKMSSDSKFANWLGSDKKQLEKCSEYYIGLLYADINKSQGIPLLTAQFSNLGFDQQSIMDFSDNLKAHPNYKDWRLFEYKIYGFCKNKDSGKDLVISIPGYHSQEL